MAYKAVTGPHSSFCPNDVCSIDMAIFFYFSTRRALDWCWAAGEIALGLLRRPVLRLFLLDYLPAAAWPDAKVTAAAGARLPMLPVTPASSTHHYSVGRVANPQQDTKLNNRDENKISKQNSQLRLADNIQVS